MLQIAAFIFLGLFMFYAVLFVIGLILYVLSEELSYNQYNSNKKRK